MKSRTMSKMELKFLNQDLFQEYGIEPFSKKSMVTMVDGEEYSYIRVDGNVDFFYLEDELLPTLKKLLNENFLKKVTVDMGAVKFVASGADVMRPGIVEIEDGFHEGEIVAIIDVQNKKPLAIGKALFGSSEMDTMKEGKAIESIHFVGDKIWKLE
ncbi:RNA-binding protein [Candidatus Woesearchaeota archaeon]|nr:RNA-binding protein [Candidatus Woesearchaeota archaeon]